MLKTIRGECTPPQRYLQAEDAATYIANLIQLAEAYIAEAHATYGSVRWLWYIRRCPDALFAGQYNTTAGYDRTLAESISWFFPTVLNDATPARLAFDTSDSSLRHLCRFLACVKVLSDLHMCFRRAGKGSEIDTSRLLLTYKTDRESEDAMRVYDTRHSDSQQHVFMGLGMSLVEARDEELRKDDDEFPFCLAFEIKDPVLAPIAYPHEGKLLPAEIEVRHVLKFADLRPILDPLSDGGLRPDYVAEVAPLVQLLMMLGPLSGDIPWLVSSVFQQGYFLVKGSALHEIVGAWLPRLNERIRTMTDAPLPETSQQWEGALSSLSPTLWPLRAGGVTRRVGDNVLIDVTGATRALIQRLEFHRSLRFSNERAARFELQCQAAIDASAWAGPEQIRALRGRPLRLGGRVVTDSDAIGAFGEKLLLVACKSLIYDREYDRGAFQAVRNAQGTVNEAVEHWAKVVDTLTLNRVGDNYDFSAFSEIAWVVCTPFVVYTTVKSNLEPRKDGLRTCVSLEELTEWLDGFQKDSGDESAMRSSAESEGAIEGRGGPAA